MCRASISSKQILLTFWTQTFFQSAGNNTDVVESLLISFGGPIAVRCLATYLIPEWLGEGSGWDLRVRLAPASASGNLGTWKSGNLEIWGPGNSEIQKFRGQKMEK